MNLSQNSGMSVNAWRGSFEERMGRVACWNAVMDENRYMVRKWNGHAAE